jgi:hypothetical protein
MTKMAQIASLLVQGDGTSPAAPSANQGNTSISTRAMHRFKKAATRAAMCICAPRPLYAPCLLAGQGFLPMAVALGT